MDNHIITITGGDRIGKATQSRLLAERLGAELISFPDYSTITGQLIRGALTNSNLRLKRRLKGPPEAPGRPYSVLEDTEVPGFYEKKDYHFQCLNMMARLEAQPYIEKTLKHKHIVADRYDVDALVYGTVDGCKTEWVEGLLTCIRPSDLVIVLNGPSFSREEVADVNETNAEFCSKVKKLYLEFADKYGWKVVNTMSANSVEESITKTHELVFEEFIRFGAKKVWNEFDRTSKR